MAAKWEQQLLCCISNRTKSYPIGFSDVRRNNNQSHTKTKG
jgi:hypothetical protein